MSKKSLSQYFLINYGLARDIAEVVAHNSPDGQVVEIGGGKGILTRALLHEGLSVRTVEIDSKLADCLAESYRDNANLTVVNEDILKLNPETLSKNGNISLCGNIPYHISGLILRWISENSQYISHVVLMVQKEVGLRIAGKPGDREFGALSIILGIDYDAEYLFDVDQENFKPQPKVDSAVVQLGRRQKPMICADDRDAFIKLVKKAFSARRKKIINSLKGYRGLDAERLSEFFVRCGLDSNLRPDKISISEYIELYYVIHR
ncbi:MAG: ribosomal RNA small subunit methyltransferase A [candidate division Zixibacteria bacterium]|nr:ribosomal RNA small subunit methyltransferase A [candidate division Zixibacteria bacterium]